MLLSSPLLARPEGPSVLAGYLATTARRYTIVDMVIRMGYLIRQLQRLLSKTKSGRRGEPACTWPGLYTDMITNFSCMRG
jgi:hypothetical protein